VLLCISFPQITIYIMPLVLSALHRPAPGKRGFRPVHQARIRAPLYPTARILWPANESLASCKLRRCSLGPGRQRDSCDHCESAAGKQHISRQRRRKRTTKQDKQHCQHQSSDIQPHAAQPWPPGPVENPTRASSMRKSLSQI
jgi:hypothetical protein